MLIATVVYIQAQIVAGGLIANIVFGVPVTVGPGCGALDAEHRNECPCAPDVRP